MTPGYKQKWEQARDEAATLQKEVNRLRALIKTSADDALKELERTRHIVDLAGLARHLRVHRFTPQQWRQRGHLPPVDFPHIKEPLWYASTIRDQFARPTRRPWYDAPEDVDALPEE